MIITNVKALNDYKTKHPETAGSLNSWHAEAKAANWTTPLEIRDRYNDVRILKDGNVVFKILGNKYRLWVIVTYKQGIIFIKQIGTHAEYNNWDLR